MYFYFFQEISVSYALGIDIRNLCTNLLVLLFISKKMQLIKKKRYLFHKYKKYTDSFQISKNNFTFTRGSKRDEMATCIVIYLNTVYPNTYCNMHVSKMRYELFLNT